MASIVKAYNSYYKADNESYVYPVEFVVRTLLGKYPNLQLDKQKFKDKKILDLGYGDGRNMPMLLNLGFHVSGVEISDEINSSTKKRLESIQDQLTLKTGHNSDIPFSDSHFDYLLACHACYYVLEGQTFKDNLNEIARVIKSKGVFICSLPFSDSYILQGAKKLPTGHYQIQNDPYNLRNGTIFRAFENKSEIIEELGSDFEDFRIGYCNDDFYGVNQKVWIVTCWKK